jgi:hypothetical protein
MKRRGTHSRAKVTASAGEESPDRRVILPGRAPKPPKPAVAVSGTNDPGSRRGKASGADDTHFATFISVSLCW